MQKLLYILTQSPYSNASGQEALDAILIGAAFDQHVSVLFMHDGVFQLKNHQQTRSNRVVDNLKEYSKTFGALADFGVESIFVLESSLHARGLMFEDLIIKPTVLNDVSATQLIAQQFRVFTF